MIYFDLYHKLKTSFDNIDICVELNDLNIKIKKRSYCSRNIYDEYHLDLLNINMNSGNSKISQDYFLGDINDKYIHSNRQFDYYIFETTTSESEGLIFLFHGLNEKKWDKYLPWAYELAMQTNKKVILFPIAFHMNRAPLVWSDYRLMNNVAKIRAVKEPNSESSFANAALSERLERLPQRLFWSGLQTYNDFYSMVKMIREGKIEEIEPYSSIDMFGYSIGAFLSLLLMMDNPDNILQKSRLFMFCGGSTYDRTFPVSKFILDQRAYDQVVNFFDNMFKDKTLTKRKISGYLKKYDIEESYFPALMFYGQFKDLREQRINKLMDRISAITLTKDNVIRPEEVKCTLQNDSMKNKIQISEMDYEHPYNHINPFPVTEKNKLKIDYSFKTTFKKAASFFV